jgi:hypothetical protein
VTRYILGTVNYQYNFLLIVDVYVQVATFNLMGPVGLLGDNQPSDEAHPLTPSSTVSTRLLNRVAGWYILRPKIAIWVNFGGPFNGKC